MPTPQTLTDLDALRDAFARSGKSQREIAKATGYDDRHVACLLGFHKRSEGHYQRRASTAVILRLAEAIDPNLDPHEVGL